MVFFTEKPVIEVSEKDKSIIMSKISIIMGVYNARDKSMIKKSIYSLLNQSLRDFELIICNDGSTNDTLQWIEEVVAGDKRVKIIHNKKNRGLAYSLNQCMEYADGEYIARMDIDDVCKRYRLEIQSKFLDDHPEYAVVGSCALLFDDNGVWGKRKVKEIPEKDIFLYGPPFIHPTIMCRSNILRSLGGYHVKWYTWRTEDTDLFARLYAAGYKGYNIQQPLIGFREDKASYQRRKFKYAFHGVCLRCLNFYRLELYPIGILFVLKPILSWMLPNSLLKLLRKGIGYQ